MKRAVTISAVICLCCVLDVASASAQQNGSEPILRATIAPTRPIVGEMSVLTLEILVPNYMSTPPNLPEFQIRNMITRLIDRINIVEQQGGSTYAGIRFRYGFYAQEPGQYRIAGKHVTVSYADNPPHTRQTILSIPTLGIEAIIPAAATSLKPFLPATTLALSQTIEKSAEQLKVGDSVTRTIRIEAEGPPSMLIPPTTFKAIDGLSAYPDPPQLTDKADPRSDGLKGERIDRVTYIFQKAGNTALPAIDLIWWNTRTGSIQHATAEAVSLSVAENPVLQQQHSKQAVFALTGWRRWADWVIEHWPMLILITGLVLGGAWALKYLLSGLAQKSLEAHARYLASERRSFTRLRRAIRAREPRATYSALLSWLERIPSLAPRYSVAGLLQKAPDALLLREISQLEKTLFGPAPVSPGWQPRILSRRLRLARRHLLKIHRAQTTSMGTSQLNP